MQENFDFEERLRRLRLEPEATESVSASEGESVERGDGGSIVPLSLSSSFSITTSLQELDGEAWHEEFARQTALIEGRIVSHCRSVGLMAIDEEDNQHASQSTSSEDETLSVLGSQITLSASELGDVRSPVSIATRSASERGSIQGEPRSPISVATQSASERGSFQAPAAPDSPYGLQRIRRDFEAEPAPDQALASDEASRSRRRERQANYLARLSQAEREALRDRNRENMAERYVSLSQERRAQARAERVAEARANYEQELEDDPFLAPPRVPSPRPERPVRGGFALNMAGFSYSPDLDYMNHPSVVIGGLTIECEFCFAKKFHREVPSLCCDLGKVDLIPHRPFPDPEAELFSGHTPLSREFLENIRAYNSLFAMTSFGVHGQIGLAEDEDGGRPGFMPTYRVQGQIYHLIQDVLPVPERPPAYLQVYFMGLDQDAAERSSIQIEHRMGLARNFQPSRRIMSILQQLFDQQNLLLAEFKSALEQAAVDDATIIIRADRTPANEHARRYNQPEIDDEVAMIVVNGERNHRDIVVRRRGGGEYRVMEMHHTYDALQYPILFWRGQSTYSWDLKQVNPVTREPLDRKLTTNSYYAYHFMLRDFSDNFLLRCRGLLNQFVVDMWVKIESERLRWAQSHQQNLRADEYHELADAIAQDRNIEDIGRRVILPATFTGSPRHMHEYTQDCMAYVRHYGRPDFFITFTCNPNWPEIRGNLMQNQNVTHRHDLVSRVFNMKLRNLISLFKDDHIFGPINCYTYNVEWQKRGLPHAHMLFWLRERIRPEIVDEVISAEIPDPEIDPVLYNYITTHMVHHCDSRCIVNGRCKHRYPRQFVSATLTADDGYPLYRRRRPEEGGQSFQTRRGVTVDNRNIVPYSPILTKAFAAHINVELCSSVKSIKYVCKYINKGSDMAIIEIMRQRNPSLRNLEINPHNEIQVYQLGRYVSSSEAFWRIFEFHIHMRYPAVIKLAVHLQGGQRVVYNPQNFNLRQSETTLTAFFSACMRDEFARTLLYTEMPSYYTYKVGDRKWERRVRGARVPGHPNIRRTDTVSRMYSVHPVAHPECFYLRLLLTRVRGPTSFHFLRTVDGVILPTYRDACLRLGILSSDAEWRYAMQEAAVFRTAPHIRHLFALILSFCSPSDPRELWSSFRDDMSDDILQRHRNAAPNNIEITYNDDIYNEALILLEDMTIRMVGKLLSQLGLPSPNRGLGISLNTEILRERNYNLDELRTYVATNEPLLNADQRSVYDRIIQAIGAGRGGFYFLDAPGGTGKTFLLNLILAKIRLDGDIIIAAASTGIASTLLEGGATAHKHFKIPINVGIQEHPTCDVARGTHKADLMKICKAIIWDECTMSNRKALDAVDIMLRDVTRINEPFGRKVILLSGDFRQTLPVIMRGSMADSLQACLKKSNLWRRVTTLRLTTNMRAQLYADNAQSLAFANLLLRIGNGQVPTNERFFFSIPNGLCRFVSTIDELIDTVYSNLNQNIHNLKWLYERAILAPTNEAVRLLNLAVQSRVDSGQSETRTYLSIDSTEDLEEAVNFPVEFLNTLSPNGLPYHQLTLKVGTPIILLRNMDPPRLCNGTRMSVTRLMNNCIRAKILAGRHRGEEVFIPRIPLKTEHDSVKFTRLQFPVRMAFALTINKAQGQSLQLAGLDLSTPCFAHGQFYVACARVGSPLNLFVYSPPIERYNEHVTKNVVCRLALE